MPSYKVTGKTSDGQAVSATLAGDSIGVVASNVQAHVTAQGKSLASLTIKPLATSSAEIKIAAPRKRNTSAEKSATVSAAAPAPAPAAPAAAGGRKGK